MRVLITRPKQRESALRAKLQAEGHDVTSFPLFEILPPVDQSFNGAFNQLCAKTHLVFVSQFAVEAIVQAKVAIPIDCKLYGVGQVTGKALQAAFPNNQVVAPTDGNSENLLSLIDLKQVQGHPFYICGGDYGRTLIYDTLAEHGAKVSNVTCYRRVPRSEGFDSILQAWQAFPFDLVMITSTEALRHLLSLMSDHKDLLLQSKFTVMGERMKKLAESYGLAVVLSSSFGF